jgi:hypothetical protein
VLSALAEVKTKDHRNTKEQATNSPASQEKDFSDKISHKM